MVVVVEGVVVDAEAKYVFELVGVVVVVVVSKIVRHIRVNHFQLGEGRWRIRRRNGKPSIVIFLLGLGFCDGRVSSLSWYECCGYIWDCKLDDSNRTCATFQE